MLPPAMSCSKAALGVQRGGQSVPNGLAGSPSSLQRAMSLLGLSNWGLQEPVLSGDPTVPASVPQAWQRYLGLGSRKTQEPSVVQPQ